MVLRSVETAPARYGAGRYGSKIFRDPLVIILTTHFEHAPLVLHCGALFVHKGTRAGPHTFKTETGLEVTLIIPQALHKQKHSVVLYDVTLEVQHVER